MGRILKGTVLVVAFGVAAAACSKTSTVSQSSPTSSPTATGSPEASALPTASTIAEPVVYGYYDGHVDTMLSTDVSNKAQAAALHINFSAALLTQPAKAFPSLYMIMGPAAPNQPVVFGSEPGEDDHSPLWQEINVRWKAGMTPVLLVKDDQIKELAGKGELTIDPTPIVLNCPIVKVS